MGRKEEVRKGGRVLIFILLALNLSYCTFSFLSSLHFSILLHTSPLLYYPLHTSHFEMKKIISNMTKMEQKISKND